MILFVIIAISFIVKIIIRFFIYSPLVCTGFLITTKILDRNASALLWIAMIVLLAYILFLIVYFIKGIIVGLYSNNNLLWIPIFLACVGYACILPAWFLYASIQAMVIKLHGNNLIAIFLDTAFGIFIYLRYQFLTNSAPKVAFPFYSAGLYFAS